MPATRADARKRLSLSTWLLLSVVAGLAAGLFFGEYAGAIAFVGDAFIGLMQMTVLPFIICSVIGNIGRLTIDESKRLAAVSFAVLFVLWHSH